MVTGGISLGIVVAFIVSFSMALSSLILTNIEVGEVVEALFQYFSAGLILAAVAAELFPLMIIGVTEEETWTGVPIGFTCGLFLVFGLEQFITWITELKCCKTSSSELNEPVIEIGAPSMSSIYKESLSSRQFSNTYPTVSVCRNTESDMEGNQRFPNRPRVPQIPKDRLRLSSINRHSQSVRTTIATASVSKVLTADLIIPVAMDCFVDGFLIGVSCAISRKAGYTLGLANTLEMSFLGMAYATSIKKCTKSSCLMRSLALYVPPVLMTGAGGLGAYLATAAAATPAVFVAFVAFGVVALVALVCGELIIEAKETMDSYAADTGKDASYVSLALYAGIFFVLMVTRIL